MPISSSQSPLFLPSWRQNAVQIVEELFPASPTRHWDDLLELRQLLHSGVDWTTTLSCFNRCRHGLEQDHYLPFFRLRRLLEGHLRLVMPRPDAQQAFLNRLDLRVAPGAPHVIPSGRIVEWIAQEASQAA